MLDDAPLDSPIFVVSDATGGTAEQMVHAALVQFEGDTPVIRVWPRVRTLDDLDVILADAHQQGALIVHTLVKPQHAEHLHEQAEARGIACIDVIGPVLSKLSVFLQQPVRGRPGRNPELDEAYFRRIAAVEYTVNADDGRGLGRLKAADIVLVGISRTSKTPVATYLAGQGYKVANVPLVHGLPIPEELATLERGRVFALTIDAEQLVEIRSVRMQQLGVRDRGDYADVAHILEELRWATALFRARRWPVINVTNQAIEETASQLLRLRGRIIDDQGR